jgi:lysozyme family protein
MYKMFRDDRFKYREITRKHYFSEFLYSNSAVYQKGSIVPNFDQDTQMQQIINYVIHIDIFLKFL